MLALGDPPDCSCTVFRPSYKKPVVAPFIVLLILRPKASYWKLADSPDPLIDTSWFRAFQMYVIVPSLGRLPLLSKVRVCPPNPVCWFAEL